VLLPASLTFLLGVGDGLLVPVISISRYLAFTTLLIMACGIVFELPLGVFVLARLRVLSAATLRRQRRAAALVMAIAAAILTPTTDVATMVLMTLPMLLLYEVSIGVAQFAAPGKDDHA
jgi:sec-independent protein translocase protein TatC